MRTLLFAALLVLATPASAADITRSSGYFGLGVGVGASSLAKQSFLGSGAAQFSLRGGVILARRLLLGPEVTLTGQYNGWNPNTPTGAGLSSVMAEAMVFPVLSLPLNISAGAGWGSGFVAYRLPNNGTDERALAKGSNGLAWMGGVGWDFGGGPGWNFGLQARYDGANLPDIRTAHGASLHLWLTHY